MKRCPQKRPPLKAESSLMNLAAFWWANPACSVLGVVEVWGSGFRVSADAATLTRSAMFPCLRKVTPFLESQAAFWRLSRVEDLAPLQS